MVLFVSVFNGHVNTRYELDHRPNVTCKSVENKVLVCTQLSSGETTTSSDANKILFV